MQRNAADALLDVSVAHVLTVKHGHRFSCLRDAAQLDKGLAGGKPITLAWNNRDQLVTVEEIPDLLLSCSKGESSQAKGVCAGWFRVGGRCWNSRIWVQLTIHVYGDLSECFVFTHRLIVDLAESRARSSMYIKHTRSWKISSSHE